MSGEHERLRALATASKATWDKASDGNEHALTWWEEWQLLQGEPFDEEPEDRAYVAAMSPEVTLGLLDEIERLEAQLRLVMPVASDRLQPDGSHNALPDGYCPDCGGGCLRGFANHVEPFVEPSPFPAPGQVAACADEVTA